MRASAMIALVLLLSARASACSCIGQSPAEALSSADALFAGKVLNVATVQPRTALGDQQVQLRVRRSWKGRFGGVAVVITPTDGCAYAFTRGEYYLVYAYRSKDGQLRTNMCTRTETLSRAGEDLAALGEPDLLTSLRREEQLELFARVGVIAACSLALAAIFVLRRRRPTEVAGTG